jgi:hypothetical protein
LSKDQVGTIARRRMVSSPSPRLAEAVASLVLTSLSFCPPVWEQCHLLFPTQRPLTNRFTEEQRVS